MRTRLFYILFLFFTILGVSTVKSNKSEACNKTTTHIIDLKTNRCAVQSANVELEKIFLTPTLFQRFNNPNPDKWICLFAKLSEDSLKTYAKNKLFSKPLEPRLQLLKSHQSYSTDENHHLVG